MMFVFLPAMVWGLTYLILRRDDWRETVLIANVFVGVMGVLLTELLSLIKHLTPLGISISWTVILLGMAVIGWQRKAILHQHQRHQTAEFSGIYLAWLGIALTTAMIAALAPINNWDSMTYHLPRVMHWLQNASVNHYPTHIVRQLYQSPFAEYAILHTIALSGGDGLANFVQWWSWLSSAIAISLIARELGAERRGQYLAASFVLTLPMAILQATNTQNDLVISLWLVCLSYAGLRFAKHLSITYAMIVGVSLGLAVLTKGTAYVLALPVMIAFGVVGVLRIRFAVWKPFLTVIILFLILNGGHYWRNWSAFKTPLGLAEGYGNERIGVDVLISNTLRNLSLNAVTPSEPFNYQVIYRPVRWLHSHLLPIDLDDPRTTYLNRPFELNYINASEDSAPNPAHFYLYAAALLTLPLYRSPRKVISVVWLVMITFLLFSLVFKWQIWNTRLLTPLFVLMAAPAGVIIGQWQPRWLLPVIMWGLVFLSVPYLLFNCNRPLITLDWVPFTCNRPAIFMPQVDQIFSPRQGIQSPYVTAVEHLTARECDQVGLILGGDSWEYPLWWLTDDVQFWHIHVTNPSSALPSNVPSEICAIVSSPAMDTRAITNSAVYHKVFESGTRPDDLALYLAP